MNIVIVFVASLCTVYIAGRLVQRAAFTRADIVLSVIAGMLGLGLAQLLTNEGITTGSLGLPLVAAIIAALGLKSRQPRDTLV